MRTRVGDVRASKSAVVVETLAPQRTQQPVACATPCTSCDSQLQLAQQCWVYVFRSTVECLVKHIHTELYTHVGCLRVPRMHTGCSRSSSAHVSPIVPFSPHPANTCLNDGSLTPVRSYLPCTDELSRLASSIERRAGTSPHHLEAKAMHTEASRGNYSTLRSLQLIRCLRRASDGCNGT